MVDRLDRRFSAGACQRDVVLSRAGLVGEPEHPLAQRLVGALDRRVGSDCAGNPVVRNTRGSNSYWKGRSSKRGGLEVMIATRLKIAAISAGIAILIGAPRAGTAEE